MTYKQLKNKLMNYYLEWTNDFLTVTYFAEHYDMSFEHANRVLVLGKRLYLREHENIRSRKQ